jgi:hypothetical protein
MHGSENVMYAFVGFFTKSNKQWSSSLYVFPHKMEMTNVLYCTVLYCTVPSQETSHIVFFIIY